MTEVKPTALMSAGGKVTIALPKDFMRQTKPIQCRTIKLNNSTITVKTSLLKQLVTGTAKPAAPATTIHAAPSIPTSTCVTSNATILSASPSVTNVKKVVMTSSASNTPVSSVPKPSSGPKQNEMMDAIEELRRENERVLNELGATQDLLDLFENYRKLLRDHLDVCICAGRDHNISQWRRFEREYRRLSALQRPEPGEIVNGGSSNASSYSRHRATSILANNKYTEMNGHGPRSALEDDYSMQPAGQSKSLVMSYLDRITPVRMDSPSQEPSPKVDITPDGNTFWIRKRPGPDGQLPQPVITKKPKIVRNNDQQDVERLDKLNNALDQILMGRFDALNQLRDDGEEYDEEEEEEERRVIVNGGRGDGSEDGDGEDEDDEDDVVLVDEIKNREQNNSGRTILSAALQSGFKPYPTYNYPVASTSSANSNKSLLLNNSSMRMYSPQPQIQSGSPLQQTNDVRFNMYQKRPHLTSEERMDIINRLKKNESGARIARDYGITKQAVSAIKRRAQLMGDQFKLQEHKVYLMQGTSNGGSRTHSPVPPNGLRQSGTGKPTMVTINVANHTPPVASMDSSLVSRQLKQQRAPSGLVRPNPFVTNYPRLTTNLCLPVNPVAILKSQMASKQTVSKDPAQNSPKIDNKRLILPRLLQGTESYEPIYGQLVKKFNLRPSNEDGKDKSSSDEEKPEVPLRDEQSEESDTNQNSLLARDSLVEEGEGARESSSEFNMEIKEEQESDNEEEILPQQIYDEEGVNEELSGGELIAQEAFEDEEDESVDRNNNQSMEDEAEGSDSKDDQEVPEVDQ